MSADFAVGDRVRVKQGLAERYIQPWRDRFKSGRSGTIVALKSERVLGHCVVFDHKFARREADWRLCINPSDLEPEPKAVEGGTTAAEDTVGITDAISQPHQDKPASSEGELK